MDHRLEIPEACVCHHTTLAQTQVLKLAEACNATEAGVGDQFAVVQREALKESQNGDGGNSTVGELSTSLQIDRLQVLQCRRSFFSLWHRTMAGALPLLLL